MDNSNKMENSGGNDFDFYVGHWRVTSKKLLRPLANCTEWETFEARQTMQKLPGGIGNFDDFVSETWRPGFVGMSLRIFNPQTGLWSIYWLNNQNGGIDSKTGALLPPVVGRFRNGVGIFEAPDEYAGQPIVVRYTWSDISANRARWEQAFSPDGGASWEVNWIMQMERVA